MNRQNKLVWDFLINNLLIFTGVMTIISGFVLQLGFHIGNAGAHRGQTIPSQISYVEPVRQITSDNTVWGFDYASWAAIHKVTIVLLSLLMVYHLVIHWKWYKTVFTKHLISKNRQVIILSALFSIVAFTGLVPWFVYLSGSNSFIRSVLIEIHDKLAILFAVYLILHVIKRFRWFSNTFNKLKI